MVPTCSKVTNFYGRMKFLTVTKYHLNRPLKILWHEIFIHMKETLNSFIYERESLYLRAFRLILTGLVLREDDSRDGLCDFVEQIDIYYGESK